MFGALHQKHLDSISYGSGISSGMVELEAADAYVVPVSRSRVSWLKSRIGARPSEIVPQST